MMNLLKQPKIQILIIVLLTVLAYINIFQNQFLIDDKTFIVNWEQGRSLSNIGDFFRGAVPTGHEGVYRPLRSVLYAVYHQLWGTNPFGYHLHGLLVHISSAVLVYLILVQLTKKRRAAFIGGLLFGLHPLHTESITYISASMEMTGVVFFFAAFLAYLKKHWKRTAILALLAFLFYEMTLTLPLIIILSELILKRPARKLNNFLPLISVSGGYLLLRLLIFTGGTRGDYLAGSIPLTLLVIPQVFVKYLTLLLWPFNQAHNHTLSGNIEAILYRGHSLEGIKAQSFFDLNFLVPVFILLVLGGIIIWLWKKKPLISFALGWFFIGLLPVSNLIPQWSLLHEKFLYLSSFSLALIGGLFFEYFFLNKKITAIIVLVIITCGYFILTFNRNQDWKDAVTLWSKDTQTYPTTDAYAYFQRGEAYRANGERDLAIIAYQKAFATNPSFAIAIGSAARTYADLGQTGLAIINYKQAIEADPNFWEGRYNLANAYRSLGKFDLAAGEYRQVILIQPNFELAQINLKEVTSQ